MDKPGLQGLLELLKISIMSPTGTVNLLQLAIMEPHYTLRMELLGLIGLRIVVRMIMRVCGMLLMEVVPGWQ